MIAKKIISMIAYKYCSNLGDKEIIVIAGDLSGHFGSNAEDYEDPGVSCSYENHSNNTLFKKRTSKLVT